jgi:hypothetical protein
VYARAKEGPTMKPVEWAELQPQWGQGRTMFVARFRVGADDWRHFEVEMPPDQMEQLASDMLECVRQARSGRKIAE